MTETPAPGQTRPNQSGKRSWRIAGGILTGLAIALKALLLAGGVIILYGVIGAILFLLFGQAVSLAFSLLAIPAALIYASWGGLKLSMKGLLEWRNVWSIQPPDMLSLVVGALALFLALHEDKHMKLPLAVAAAAAAFAGGVALLLMRVTWADHLVKNEKELREELANPQNQGAMRVAQHLLLSILEFVEFISESSSTLAVYLAALACLFLYSKDAYTWEPAAGIFSFIAVMKIWKIWSKAASKWRVDPANTDGEA